MGSGGGCVSAMHSIRDGCVSGPNFLMAEQLCRRTDSRGMQAVEGMWRTEGERERGKEREGEGTRKGGERETKAGGGEHGKTV